LWLLSRHDGAPLIRVLKTAALLLAMSVAGFLLGCPFSVLAFPEFWGEGVNGFAYELFVHTREGSGEIFQNTGNGWWYHLTFNLPFAMTTPLIYIALLALSVIVALTLPRRRAFFLWPLLAFIIVYFLALGFSQVRYMRYVLPLLPALCVLIARFTLRLSTVLTVGSMALASTNDFETGASSQSDWVQRKAAQSTAMTVHVFDVSAIILSLFLLLATVDVLRPFARPDPRDTAAAWLKTNANTSTIALASDRPWFWSVPLSPQDSPPGAATSIEEALAQSATVGASYNLSTLAFDATKLSRDKPQYVVMSELEWRDKERLQDANYEAFMTSLDQLYEREQTFAGASTTLPGRAWVPHDFMYTNPQVRVYRLKSAS
jgi:hypothetical protein